MSPINPNSAFARVTFDLPTPIALQLDEVVSASGKSKKRWLADEISALVTNASRNIKANKRSKK